MKKFSILSAIAFVLLSCAELAPREEQRDDTLSSLYVSLSPKSASRSARDGDEILSLRVWLVEKDTGLILRVVSSDQPYSDQVGGITLSSDRQTASVDFINIERGEYTLYFIANSDANSSYVAGNHIDDAFRMTTISKEEYTDASGMPLSLSKDATVGPGNNSISASLLRVCSRIRVSLRNSTPDKRIYIHSISLNDISPNKSYLFPQSSFLSTVSYSSAGSMNVITAIDPSEEKQLLSSTVMETALQPGIDIMGGIFPALAPKPSTSVQTIVSYSFEETPEALVQGTNYFIMNKSMRYLLKRSGDVAAIEFLANGDAPKNDLLSSSTIEDYIWTYDWSNRLRNVGAARYLYGTASSLSVSSYSATSFNFSGSAKNGYSISSTINKNDYYLVNQVGSLAFTTTHTSPADLWYFYEANSVSRALTVLVGAEKNIIYSHNTLKYVDPVFGTATLLDHIGRNEDIEIRINVFFNEMVGKLYFETEVWNSVTNETTFD